MVLSTKPQLVSLNLFVVMRTTLLISYHNLLWHDHDLSELLVVSFYCLATLGIVVGLVDFYFLLSILRVL